MGVEIASSSAMAIFPLTETCLDLMVLMYERKEPGVPWRLCGLLRIRDPRMRKRIIEFVEAITRSWRTCARDFCYASRLNLRRRKTGIMRPVCGWA
jgi:hypothetical protein